ncbi:MAG: carboxymuconolactone decarboxylase family protein [Candidatus Omnitrophica bacterium]|nr:carboxymuconolactone decarboxylase family protein [Candidatus Omnitrophota bacterium]
MEYDTLKTLKEFNELMTGIRKAIPDEYDVFIKEKDRVMKSGKLPDRVKWLLLLVASATEKCPVCIPRAVRHCLEAGWTREEMLEACMVAVLIGGSSVMTYVTLVDKAIQDLSGQSGP